MHHGGLAQMFHRRILLQVVEPELAEVLKLNTLKLKIITTSNCHTLTIPR
jgi:hypothetical protein